MKTASTIYMIVAGVLSLFGAGILATKSYHQHQPAIAAKSVRQVRAGFPAIIQRNAPAPTPGVTMTVNVAGTGQIDGTYIASPVVPINSDQQQYVVTLTSANPNYGWPQGKIIVNRGVKHIPGGGVIIGLNAGAWYQMDAYGTVLGEHGLIGGDPLAGGSCSFTAPWQGAFGNSTVTITVSP